MDLDCNNNERKNPNRVLESIILGNSTAIPTTANDPNTGQVVDSQTGLADTTSNNELTTNNISNPDSINPVAEQLASPDALVVQPDDSIFVPGADEFEEDASIIPTNSMVPNIINELRTSFPQLENRVFGILNLQKLFQRAIQPDQFTIYVTHDEDRNLQRGDNKRNRFRFEHTLQIYALLPLHINDLRGEFALDQLKSFRDILLSRLWGYQIAGNFERMIYEGGEFLSIQNNVAYYRYEFSTIENIDRASFNNNREYNFQLNKLCFCPTNDGFVASLEIEKSRDAENIANVGANIATPNDENNATLVV